MGMKYSSGPQVPTMPRVGPDSVEVRSRGGDARQFSPLAQRTSRVLESPEGTSLAVALSPIRYRSVKAVRFKDLSLTLMESLVLG